MFISSLNSGTVVVDDDDDDDDDGACEREARRLE